MSAPYTRETIAAIRDQASRNVSPRKIAKELGWDVAQLERVARKHDIRLVTAPVTKPASMLADGKLPLLRNRDAVTWDANVVSFRDRQVKVTETQRHILSILVRAAHPVSSQALRERAGYPDSAVHSFKTQLCRLRKKLETIGLTVTPGSGAGYQLVVVKVP
jgi:hypothetical protein